MRTLGLLDRRQLLRAIPRHVFYAMVSGALTGLALYGLQCVDGWAPLEFVASLAMLLLYALGAALPVAIPARQWLFGGLAAVALACLLLPALLLAGHLRFGHSFIGGQFSPLVNLLTVAALTTGLCLGLFYGLLVGRLWAGIVGVLWGLSAAYLLGLFSAGLVAPAGAGEELVYRNAWGLAWQCALALGVLHLSAAFGAVLGR